MSVSRRQFLAASGVLVAGTWVPDWADAFQAAADTARVEAAEAALARATALGASYADIRINRYRRESIAALKLGSFTFTSISDAI